MQHTNEYNESIKAMLDGLGIKCAIVEGYLTVDRTSMVQNASPGGIDGEDEAYRCVLELIREHVSAINSKTWIAWTGRTDDWLIPDVYIKD